MVETGLLEQPELRVRLLPGGNGGLFSGPPRTQVGVVRAARVRRPWWWGWPGDRPVLAVYETGDEPLLCTVHRCWGFRPWLRVLDGVDSPVGFVLGEDVRGRFGERVATRRGEWFLTPRGRALARLTQAGDERCLWFDEGVRADPLVKMLLLAAALTA